MRHVEEEWVVLVLLDERHGALGVLCGELFLFFAGHLCVDDVVLVDERQVRPAVEALLHRQVQHARMVRPHVVRIWQTEVVVEPVLHRKKLFVMAKVPFTVDRSGVVPLFTDLGERHFAGVDAVSGSGAESTKNTNSHVVAASEQPRPRGAANGLGYIKVRELAPLLGHAVEVGRWICLGPERANVRIAHVVDENDNNIRGLLVGGGNLVRRDLTKSQ